MTPSFWRDWAEFMLRYAAENPSPSSTVFPGWGIAHGTAEERALFAYFIAEYAERP